MSARLPSVLQRGCAHRSGGSAISTATLRTVWRSRLVLPRDVGGGGPTLDIAPCVDEKKRGASLAPRGEPDAHLRPLCLYGRSVALGRVVTSRFPGLLELELS